MTVPALLPGDLALTVLVLQVSDIVQQLPGGVRGVVESLPPLRSAEGISLYGSGGMMTVGGIMKLVGRYRSDSSTKADASAPAGTVVTTAEGDTPPGIKNDETAFTLPAFIPLSKGIRKVSHNEIHALEIGAVVGFVIVWLYSIGRQNVAAGLVIAFVASALGFERYKSKAVATVRMEPWYALIALALGGGIAYGVFLA